MTDVNIRNVNEIDFGAEVVAAELGRELLYPSLGQPLGTAALCFEYTTVTYHRDVSGHMAKRDGISWRTDGYSVPVAQKICRLHICDASGVSFARRDYEGDYQARSSSNNQARHSFLDNHENVLLAGVTESFAKLRSYQAARAERGMPVKIDDSHTYLFGRPQIDSRGAARQMANPDRQQALVPDTFEQLVARGQTLRPRPGRQSRSY